MIYTLPFIAALIGWFTNMIAVKMLFRPRKPVRLLFWTIQGIFPKRQKLLAEKIGKMVGDELFNINDIKENIASPEHLVVIHDGISDKLDDFLNVNVKKKFPLLSIFLGKATKTKIREEIMLEVKEMTPEMINNYLSQMEESLDVEAIIRSKVELLSPVKLENLIMGILKNEFSFIGTIGAVIGFLIGVIQVLLVQI